MNYNKDFLKQLDLQKNKKVYARVTSLTLEELPLETLEGRITSGSINVDGQSAVRRTCQLSFVVPKDEAKISNYLWGLDTKFKLEIGVENTIEPNYEQIIWFK